MEISGMSLVSIDDNKTNLLMVEVLAKTLDVAVNSFLNPIEGLEHIKQYGCDIVITDYMMPELDGVELIKEIRKFDKSIPIIMLTAVGDDIDLQIEALNYGATDFLNKPINAPVFKARVVNLLTLRKSQLIIQDRALLLEEEVRKATQIILDREHETLVVLGKTAEYKDPETGAHVARVAHYSRLLAQKAGLNKKMQDIIFYASPFHDIGKVGIPDKILLKPARLDEDEFEIMKNHANIGYEILKHSKSEYLKAGGVIAMTHHEKWDGSGYPKGLKGETIPIFGRIVAIADVFDALTSTRPYKKAWSLEDAFAFLTEQKGKHFDSALVECFAGEKEGIVEIFNSIKEES